MTTPLWSDKRIEDAFVECMPSDYHLDAIPMAKVIRDDYEAQLQEARQWVPLEEEYWGYLNVERNGRVITVFGGADVERDKEYIIVPLPDNVRLCRRVTQEGQP